MLGVRQARYSALLPQALGHFIAAITQSKPWAKINAWGTRGNPKPGRPSEADKGLCQGTRNFPLEAEHKLRKREGEKEGRRERGKEREREEERERRGERERRRERKSAPYLVAGTKAKVPFNIIGHGDICLPCTNQSSILAVLSHRRLWLGSPMSWRFYEAVYEVEVCTEYYGRYVGLGGRGRLRVARHGIYVAIRVGR